MARGALMKQSKNEDPRELGGIDLPTIQKYVNYWYSYSVDLFGSEISTNAADFFAAGLKGRWRESKDYTEHSGLGQTREVIQVRDGKLVTESVPLRNAMNEELRDQYAKDCARVVRRWNKALVDEGVDFEIKLPDTRFHRRQGIYSDHHFNLDGSSSPRRSSRRTGRDATESDRAYVKSLMKPVLEPGKFANYTFTAAAAASTARAWASSTCAPTAEPPPPQIAPGRPPPLGSAARVQGPRTADAGRKPTRSALRLVTHSRSAVSRTPVVLG